MTLVRWTPIKDRIANPYYRYLSSLFDDEQETEAIWHPRMNAAESDKEFILTIDLPGVSKKDVSIKMKDRILTITGERKTDTGKSLKNHICEICNGKFERTVRFNEDVNESGISASYKNGVLTVVIPKAKPSVSREIKID